MVLPWRLGRHLAARTIGHGLLVAAVAGALLAALPVSGPLDAWLPWCLWGPALCVGAQWTRWRLAQKGEEQALLAVAPGPGLLWAVAVLCALSHLPWILVGGQAPDMGSPPGEVQVSAAGAVVLVRESTVFWLDPEGNLAVRSDLPPGFRPQPADPARHRRHLLLAVPPPGAGDDPLDPAIGRWLWLLWGGIGPGLALLLRRGGWLAAGGFGTLLLSVG